MISVKPAASDMGTSKMLFKEDERPKVISCGLVAQRAKLFEQKIERNRIMQEDLKSGVVRQTKKSVEEEEVVTAEAASTSVIQTAPNSSVESSLTTAMTTSATSSSSAAAVAVDVMTSSIESTRSSVQSYQNQIFQSRRNKRSFLDALVTSPAGEEDGGGKVTARSSSQRLEWPPPPTTTLSPRSETADANSSVVSATGGGRTSSVMSSKTSPTSDIAVSVDSHKVTKGDLRYWQHHKYKKVVNIVIERSLDSKA